MASHSENVGILALEMYFPTSYVLQSELEEHDKVSSGKYTIGLGQDAMAFCNDNEDVISMSLTAVKRLLEKHGVDRRAVGRLEVGSETVIDKSKAIKTAIMPLFQEVGNFDVEGVDSCNACYSGTAALFNAFNWVESSAWDGRYAVVVATDSAVYAEGPARPTGGAGAVALLVGPGASLVPERKIVSSYSTHAYDFYKPKLASEYPVVDGKLSQNCYISALDGCYEGFCKKYEKIEGKPFSLSDADFVLFHSPYNKLVQKSFARLLYSDFLRLNTVEGVEDLSSLQPFRSISFEDSISDRNLEKASMQLSKKLYELKVSAGAFLPKQTGNMYSASLYSSLASLLYKQGGNLEGKRILLFSYGSGLMASMFSLRVCPLPTDSPFAISKISEAMNIQQLLDSRLKVCPKEFVETLELMETRYGASAFVPVASPHILRPQTFFLSNVDELYRRFYEHSGPSPTKMPPIPTSENGVGK